ncbi:class I tRNA ligase family protein (plasmid) [Priestia sp. MF3]|uniref:class I tRNA ligase family protein n=1 Tax=Priestia sp. MF3 TaxID=3404779 RepID=UPI003BA1E235
MCTNYIITSPPPTTNGDLHLGHLSGPYLHADVFAKAKQTLGHKVVHLSGTDDHQSYVVTKAKEEKRSIKDTITEYREEIIKTLLLADINIDFFEDPTNNKHIKFVQSFFLDLYEKGVFIEKNELGYYCKTCDEFLFEAHIKGKCPNCSCISGGNYCEACGQPNNPLNLVEPYCTTCKKTPIKKKLSNLFFPLENYRNLLEQYFDNNASKYRSHLKDLISNMLSQPLPDVPITNYYKWGIPVPLDSFKGYILNVWFEMFPGHINSLEEYCKINSENNQNNNWLRNENPHIVQFLGFDNSFYYIFLHQALALASNKYALSDSFITNKFYLLEGQKFSTSRGHAIWAKDFLRKEPSDIVRFYLCNTSPEEEENNFSETEYNVFKNNIYHCLVSILTKLKNATIHNKQYLSNQDLKIVETTLIKYEKKLTSLYKCHDFSLIQISEVLKAFLTKINHLNIENLYKQQVGLIIKAMSSFLYPLMPKVSECLNEILNEKFSNNFSIQCSNFVSEIDIDTLDDLIKMLNKYCRSSITI